MSRTTRDIFRETDKHFRPARRTIGRRECDVWLRFALLFVETICTGGYRLACAVFFFFFLFRCCFFCRLSCYWLRRCSVDDRTDRTRITFANTFIYLKYYLLVRFIYFFRLWLFCFMPTCNIFFVGIIKTDAQNLFWNGFGLNLQHCVNFYNILFYRLDYIVVLLGEALDWQGFWGYLLLFKKMFYQIPQNRSYFRFYKFNFPLGLQFCLHCNDLQ